MSIRKLLYTCSSIVVSSWIAAFVTGRIATYHQFYTDHSADYHEASFLLTEVCFNDTIKARLGSNAIMCEQASRTLAIIPMLNALYSTASVTYLCGSTSCSDLFLHITSSWSSFIFTVGFTLAVSPVLYRKLFKWGVKRVRQRRRHNHLSHYYDPSWAQDEELLPQIATPVNMPSISKEKIH